MEFIRKNVLMLVVLSLALLISIGLSYLTFLKHRDMTKSMQETEKIREEIKNLIKQKPAPMTENLAKIKNDIAVFDKKLKETRALFGQPYKGALEVFAKNVDTNGDALLEKFREFWKKEAKKGSNHFQLLIKFKSSLDQEKLEKAMGEFTKAVQARTVEPVDQSNIDEFLLASLGFPRTMSDVVICKGYIFAMQRALTLKLSGGKEKTSSPDSAPMQEIQKFPFGFGEYENKMPLVEDIPVIIKHWTILEDIVNRLVSVDIRQIDAVNKLNGLNGEEDKGFIRFRYSIAITGDMDSIRKFVNSLQDAYRENKIYIIKDISLEKISDDAKKLNETKSGTPTAAAPAPPSAGPRGDAKALAKPEDDEERLPFNQRKSYGMPILGVSKICKAVIEFDYVIYTGDELKLKK